MKRIPLAVVAGLVLAACAAEGEGGPASYTVGRVHGCDSGFTDLDMTVNYFKDEARYRADPEYRRGWDDGHAQCYEEGLRPLQAGGM